MGRKKKEIVNVEANVPAVLYDGITPLDYLEVKEKEIFTNIWAIGMNGTKDDAVRLKALLGLFNKIRPDKNRLDVAMKSEAPFNILMNAMREVESNADEKRVKSENDE